MKQFLALFLVSALVFTASAELNVKAVHELLTGFTNGLNFPELNPSFENCSIAINLTKQYANDVVNASEQENPEAFATAVSSFGFSFAASIRSCGKAIRLVRTLLDTVTVEMRNLTQDSLVTHLFTNLMAFTTKFNALKLNFQNGNFLATGENFAEIFKLLVFHGEEPHTHRQLLQINEVVKKVELDVDGLLLGVQGFIEEANTTIVVNHYTGLVNDTTFFVNQFGALQEAIQAENFSAIVAIVTNVYKYMGIVSKDYALVKNETSAFIHRDLPLFDNEEKISKAVESLFTDLPTTLTNIMRITNAYKVKDHREVGHGSGAVYNQLRKGAQN